jgi:hypothetical protein
MNRMTVRSRVDADGVLRLAIPVGAGHAAEEMQVTIETVEPAADSTTDGDWVDSFYGKWQGPFERIDDGPLEERNPL